ncbi:MAG: hydrogenase maturation nickel metallochaperone HypA, partial [Rhodoferax sp.]|nr:hydrogenase maturation nickel metallochaperone HypA [Rhodoferax sp.]
MHEMSLCESIMQIIEDEAQRQGFERVIRVRLEIGRLSGVEI